MGEKCRYGTKYDWLFEPVVAIEKLKIVIGVSAAQRQLLLKRTVCMHQKR
jgi:hypothetical protein